MEAAVETVAVLGKVEAESLGSGGAGEIRPDSNTGVKIAHYLQGAAQVAAQIAPGVKCSVDATIVRLIIEAGHGRDGLGVGAEP